MRTYRELLPNRPLFSWLHLAQIQLPPEGEASRYAAQAVLSQLHSCVVQLGKRGGPPRPEAIFITGGLGAGTAGEDEATRTWLDGLAGALQLGPENVHCVPGSTDAAPSPHEGPMRPEDRRLARLLESLRSGGEHIDEILAQDAEYEGDARLLLSRFERYERLTRGLGGGAVRHAGLAWSDEIPVASQLRLRLLGLNTALLAGGEQVRLRLGRAQVWELSQPQQGEKKPPVEVAFCLTHHTFDQLNDGEDARRWLDQTVDAYLFGQGGHGCVLRSQERGGVGRSVVELSAAPQPPTGQAGVSAMRFNVGGLFADEAGRLSIRVWPYIWRAKTRDFRCDIEEVPPDRRFMSFALGRKIELWGRVEKAAQASPLDQRLDELMDAIRSEDLSSLGLAEPFDREDLDSVASFELAFRALGIAVLLGAEVPNETLAAAWERQRSLMFPRFTGDELGAPLFHAGSSPQSAWQAEGTWLLGCLAISRQLGRLPGANPALCPWTREPGDLPEQMASVLSSVESSACWERGREGGAPWRDAAFELGGQLFDQGIRPPDNATDLQLPVRVARAVAAGEPSPINIAELSGLTRESFIAAFAVVAEREGGGLARVLEAMWRRWLEAPSCRSTIYFSNFETLDRALPISAWSVMPVEAVTGRFRTQILEWDHFPFSALRPHHWDAWIAALDPSEVDPFHNRRVWFALPGPHVRKAIRMGLFSDNSRGQTARIIHWETSEKVVLEETLQLLKDRKEEGIWFVYNAPEHVEEQFLAPLAAWFDADPASERLLRLALGWLRARASSERPVAHLAFREFQRLRRVLEHVTPKADVAVDGVSPETANSTPPSE